MLLQADPDMVSGIWFVGGLIGGNLAAVNGRTERTGIFSAGPVISWAK